MGFDIYGVMTKPLSFPGEVDESPAPVRHRLSTSANGRPERILYRYQGRAGWRPEDATVSQRECDDRRREEDAWAEANAELVDMIRSRLPAH